MAALNPPNSELSVFCLESQSFEHSFTFESICYGFPEHIITYIPVCVSHSKYLNVSISSTPSLPITPNLTQLISYQLQDGIAKWETSFCGPAGIESNKRSSAGSSPAFLWELLAAHSTSLPPIMCWGWVSDTDRNSLGGKHAAARGTDVSDWRDPHLLQCFE